MAWATLEQVAREVFARGSTGASATAATGPSAGRRWAGCTGAAGLGAGAALGRVVQEQTGGGAAAWLGWRWGGAGAACQVLVGIDMDLLCF
jgi:hypothetical protein